MIVVLSLVTAHAGVIAVATSTRIWATDTRNLSYSEIEFWSPDYDGFGDIAWDPVNRYLILEAPGLGVPDCMLAFYPLTLNYACLPVPMAGGVAQDSVGVIHYRSQAVEYFPPMDAFLSLRNGIESVDEMGVRTVIAPRPLDYGISPLANALAWDEDLKLLWVSTGYLPGPNTMALEPTYFTPVAYGELPVAGYSATGLYDNTPAQTPILFVSGTCPGELLVTVADATPGETVEIVSGTRRGRSGPVGGGCGNARSDLSNAVRRETLTADAYGLATTRLQATAPMCGTWMLQALDVGSCLTTEVRPVPAVVIP
jgi:hypothetical protein